MSIMGLVAPQPGSQSKLDQLKEVAGTDVRYEPS